MLSLTPADIEAVSLALSLCLVSVSLSVVVLFIGEAVNRSLARR